MNRPRWTSWALALSLALLCACATAPPPPEPQGPVWAVKRQVVRRPSSPAPRVPIPIDPQRPALGPGLLAQAHPWPEGLQALEPGELELYSINLRERVRVRLIGPRGQFQEDAAAQLSYVCRDHRVDEQHPIEPRLLKMVYLLAQTWQRPVELISGYREPNNKRKRGRTSRRSRHASGRAVDIRIPGVPSEEVAQMAKLHFENVGVGLYPTSDFVHLDVRDKSYYWLDSSGPGQAKREQALELEPVPKPGADWTLWSEDLPPLWHYGPSW